MSIAFAKKLIFLYNFFLLRYNQDKKRKGRACSMTTGGKIQRIRQHRKMTQKVLGDAIGLPANRVAQYEMGYRVPKKPLLEQMAQALQVSPLALQEPNTGNISDIMETLFWMDEDVPGVFRLTTIQFDDPDCWREEYQEEGAEACLHGNIVLPSSVFPPTVLWTENGMLDNFFKEWGEKQAAYSAGRLTREQYFEWKIRWPLDSEVRGAESFTDE